MRPISLVLISHNDKLLLRKGVDDVANISFARPLGGGIEFQETSLEAAIREVKEEVGGSIIDTELLGVIENIFTYKGKAGHEIVFLYKATLINEELLNKEKVPNLDGEGFTEWIPTSEIKEKKIRIVPDEILNYI